MKCAIFEYGFNPVQTTIAPMTTCAKTPTTSTIDKAIRSRLRGVSFRESKTHKITAAATTPVNNRFNCSIAA